MIEFTVQMSIPGHLDAEDALSNLLQGEGEEESLECAIEDAARSWIECWMRRPEPSEIRIEVKQE